jgi:hypothetical protein
VAQRINAKSHFSGNWRLPATKKGATGKEITALLAAP